MTEDMPFKMFSVTEEDIDLMIEKAGGASPCLQAPFVYRKRGRLYNR